MPLKTLPPTFTIAVQALASRLRNLLRALSIMSLDGNMKARATCAQNSTAIPTQMIILTRETALRETPATAIVPIMSTTIIITVVVTTAPVATDPSSKDVIAKMMATADPSSVPVRRRIDAYWSKQI